MFQNNENLLEHWNTQIIVRQQCSSVPAFRNKCAQNKILRTWKKRHAFARLICILDVFTGTAGTSLRYIGLNWNIALEHTGTAGTLIHSIHRKPPCLSTS